MELIELAETSRDQFNRFTAEHPSGSFLQSWEWGNWQEQLGQNRALRFFVKDNGAILLSTQVIRTAIPRLKKYYLYIPYGPLVAAAAQSDTITYFINELKKLHPESLFIRLEPKDAADVPGRPTVHIQPGKTLVVNLNQTAGQLLEAMHPKTRYNIKVAERHGIQVTSEPIVTPGYGLHLQEALSLLVGTARRQQFKSHPAGYYKRLIDFFGMQPEGACTVSVYKALYKTGLLAVALMVDFGATRTYLFGGTAATQKNLMAPYALHWAAMLDAKSKGLASYDFWGIETASGKIPGFVRFKLGWGGATIDYPPAIDIVQRQPWYTIYTLLRSLNRKFQ